MEMAGAPSRWLPNRPKPILHQIGYPMQGTECEKDKNPFSSTLSGPDDIVVLARDAVAEDESGEPSPIVGDGDTMTAPIGQLPDENTVTDEAATLADLNDTVATGLGEPLTSKERGFITRFFSSWRRSVPTEIMGPRVALFAWIATELIVLAPRGWRALRRKKDAKRPDVKPDVLAEEYADADTPEKQTPAHSEYSGLGGTGVIGGESL